MDVTAPNAPPPGTSFGPFRIDRVDRALHGPDGRIDLSGRYLDALMLLVSEQGRLVTKDRFMAEVWRGVPVTDEALTQCIRNLRRALGDDASHPRFIETVPKHGYRFIAPVRNEIAPDVMAVDSRAPASPPRIAQPLLPEAGAAGAAGGLAGLLGGLCYGLALPSDGGMGALSVLLVLAVLTMLVGVAGGAAVGMGIAAADRAAGGPSVWRVAGGLLGGLVVGGIVKLLGVDAFRLLLGRSPGDITGAFEGALLGAAVGLGVFLASRGSARRGVATAVLCGAAGGMATVLSGGSLMAGSLEQVAFRFPDSRLQLTGLFGENGLGPRARLATAAAEGALFSGFVVAALWRALPRHR